MTDPIHTPISAAAAIARLNRDLIALATREGDLDTADIDKKAKAISGLIKTVEQANAYLAMQPGRSKPGDELSDAEIDEVLDCLQTMIDNGVLRGRET